MVVGKATRGDKEENGVQCRSFLVFDDGEGGYLDVFPSLLFAFVQFKVLTIKIQPRFKVRNRNPNFAISLGYSIFWACYKMWSVVQSSALFLIIFI